MLTLAVKMCSGEPAGVEEGASGCWGLLPVAATGGRQQLQSLLGLVSVWVRLSRSAASG